MNKEYLEERWGKYCNTSKLVDDVMVLFKINGHRCSEHGVCTMLNEFFTNKERLIKLFITSENYIGGLRIAVKKEFKKDRNDYAIQRFVTDFPSKIRSNDILLKTVDDNGKTIADYMLVGKKAFSLKSLTDGTNLKSTIDSHKTCIDKFEPETGYTRASIEIQRNFMSHIRNFSRMYESTMPKEYKVDDECIIKEGTKTSRAFNKMCIHYGIDKAKDYNKLFAQYADMVTDGKRNLYFVISLNPLDYLTMSVGVSWRSCHHIREGSYKAGCESYMLDSTSIITYVVNTLADTCKIYREMFHCKGTTIIQSRIYPQGNDGATDLYKHFRGIVQEEFAKLFNLPSNQWVFKSGTSSYSNIVTHVGKHYRDLNYHDDCAIFYPVGHTKETNMIIGHDCICPYCGRPQTNSSGIFSHSSCTI